MMATACLWCCAVRNEVLWLPSDHFKIFKMSSAARTRAHLPLLRHVARVAGALGKETAAESGRMYTRRYALRSNNR